jgi:hypothetical protein
LLAVDKLADLVVTVQQQLQAEQDRAVARKTLLVVEPQRFLT